MYCPKSLKASAVIQYCQSCRWFLVLISPCVVYVVSVVHDDRPHGRVRRAWTAPAVAARQPHLPQTSLYFVLLQLTNEQSLHTLYWGTRPIFTWNCYLNIPLNTWRSLLWQRSLNFMQVSCLSLPQYTFCTKQFSTEKWFIHIYCKNVKNSIKMSLLKGINIITHFNALSSKINEIDSIIWWLCKSSLKMIWQYGTSCHNEGIAYQW